MSKLELINTLNKHIEPKLVTELFKEFEKAKTAYWLEDELKTLIHSSRFSELSILALEYISNPSITINLNKIEFVGLLPSNILNGLSF